MELIIKSVVTRYLLKRYREACIRHSALKVIQFLEGDEEAFKLWKTLAGYHKRSLVETASSRFKKLFGDRPNNKTFKNLEAETIHRFHALNRMRPIQIIN